ncbi:hypothetical protein BN2476_110297 [Paraburkholderia piptadeniae]|uniref:Uncharacterized protein n=1 Tax=Paraburkholderia piptadeniae TaxID=1701573 RepID=A0A1N7RQN3_9BURK|nr:hypothetical protein BN2476_110297 [Paraburkholderia piptadeniae]
MTPRRGTLATPNGDIKSPEPLSGKGSSCVNGLNVVYQTVYKPQDTLVGDNSSGSAAASIQKLPISTTARDIRSISQKLETSREIGANSLNTKTNFSFFVERAFCMYVFIVNNWSPIP